MKKRLNITLKYEIKQIKFSQIHSKILFKGIQKLKDNLPLYTNRAQAYIKIEKYQEAISDCEWAFRVSCCFPTKKKKLKIFL